MGESKRYVKLLRYTPEPEEVIALAAKLCYSPSNISDLEKKITKDDKGKFIDMLVKLGHLSPIEHASFTFGIEGISRACSHQLVRHRIASYSQQSQRYVSEEKGFDYIIPPSIKSDELALAKFENAMNFAQQAYDDLLKLYYEKGIKGEGANQDARFVLPNAAETKIVVTMNAHSLMNFFEKRTCNRAQWEIRDLAKEMYKTVYKIAPNVFKHAGPSCVTQGKCKEGKMTCGKSEEVKQEFEELMRI